MRRFVLALGCIIGFVAAGCGSSGSGSGEAENRPPVAAASGDQVVEEGSLVVLDGSGSSDPDGDEVTCEWSHVSGTAVILNDVSEGVASFTAPPVPAAGGVMTFLLRVRDGAGGESALTVAVTVTNVNAAPTADAGSHAVVAEGGTVTLDGSGSADPDGAIAAYRWEQVSGATGSLADPDSVAAHFTAPPVGRAGDVAVLRLTVTDDEGAQASASVTVTVTNVNVAPTADAGNDARVAATASVVLDATGSADADGDPLIFSWTILSAPAGSHATLTGADRPQAELVPDVSGLWEFELAVDDGQTAARDTVRVAVIEEPPYFACTSEDVSLLPPTGALVLGSTSDIAPACGAYVFVGNRTSNRVDLLDVRSPTQVRTFGLTDAPNRLLYHAPTSMLYVGHRGRTSLTKINVVTGEVRNIPMGGPVVDMVVVDGDRMVASLGSGSGYATALVLLNPLTERVEAVYREQSFGLWLAYDPVNAQLLSGVAGYSPSTLYRHTLAPGSSLLTFEESSRNLGSNGQGLAASPAGGRAAFACGGGNGAGYTIFDLDTLGFANVRGEWNTGAYPSDVDFDGQGARVLATNGKNLMVFGVADHVLAESHAPSFSGCSYDDLRRSRFSLGGGVAYGLADCGFDRDTARLFWFKP